MPDPDRKEDARTDLTPYSGRWVALVAGQVAGVGYTAAEAARLAHRNRPREKVALKYVEPAGGTPLTLSPLLQQIQPVLLRQEVRIYLVGGAVRDALLGRVSYDLDFVVPQQAIKVAFHIADVLGVPAYPLDRERDTGRVVLPDAGTVLDVARFRGADLEADLRDRDFTINAMALPAGATSSASIVDPCGGKEDLQAGLVRLTHPGAIDDDPVRALRALRMAARFGFRLTPETAAAVAAAAPQLERVSAERVRDELLKLLQTEAPHRAVEDMADLALLPVVLPEIAALRSVAQSSPHHEPVLAHTLGVLRRLVQVEAVVVRGERAAALTAAEAEAAALAHAQAALAPYTAGLSLHLARAVDGGLDGGVLLRLGALFHDVGKAKAQTVEEDGRIRFLGHDAVGAELAGRRLRRLRLSNEAVKHVKKIVAGHMRPLLLATSERVTRRAVYRFFRATGAAGIDIGLLSLADHLATHDGPGPDDAWHALVEMVARLYEHYFEAYEETIAPPPLLKGGELIEALHLEPGPEVGRLLRLLEEAQAAGEIKTKEEALLLAKQRLSQR